MRRKNGPDGGYRPSLSEFGAVRLGDTLGTGNIHRLRSDAEVLILHRRPCLRYPARQSCPPTPLALDNSSQG
jgi:hypothetical protein